MSTIQKEVFQMLYVLPEKTLLMLKPLLNDLLTNAVLSKDPHANIAEMDEWDKALFLKAFDKDNLEYVSFEDALIECGVSLDEISVDF
jgi:hypothetical protein